MAVGQGIAGPDDLLDITHVHPKDCQPGHLPHRYIRFSSRHQKQELTAKRQQEEEAAKKKLAEEAAAKKREEEAVSSVVLDGLIVDVENNREAAVKLTCSDIATCAGKLTLTASSMVGRGKARRARTESIGTASFLIAADKGDDGQVRARQGRSCAVESRSRTSQRHLDNYQNRAPPV